MKNLFYTALVLAAAALTGCDPGPNYKQFPNQPLPAANTQSAAVQQNANAAGGVNAQTPASGYGRIPLDPNNKEARISTAQNFYVVFDASGSMRGEKMEMAKSAMYAWLKSVPNEANLGLYVFSARGESSREFVPLGPGNKNAFRQVIEKIEDGGGTPLGSSMRVGVDALVRQYQRQLGYGEYRLVVVTDGEDDGGDAPVRNAVSYAHSVGMAIYSIGLRVTNMALKETGDAADKYVEANNLEELVKGLQDVLSETPEFDATEFQK